MNYAFVHDRIFHIGGAEAVLFDLIREKFPSHTTQNDSNTKNNHYCEEGIPMKSGGMTSQSPDGVKALKGITIYTLFSDRSSITIDNHEISIITALPRWINNIFVRGSTPHDLPDLSQYELVQQLPREEKYPIMPKIREGINIVNQVLMSLLIWLGDKLVKITQKLLDYRNLIICYPSLTKLLRHKIQKQQTSDIIISSFAAVKNVVPVGKVVKANVTLYLHSPMQYIRENYDEYVHKLASRQLLFFKPLANKLRKRDKKPRHYDTIYTNSQYTKRCALEHYFSKYSKTPVNPGNIIVKYPNIDPKIIATPVSAKTHDYYLYVGRLVKFIRETDLIIRLANEINIPLLVMGSGPDEDRLKSIASDTVTFIGQVSDIDEKIKIISQARGLINFTKESCGIATMEALVLGVPVLGYNAGATPEFVNHQSGILADSKDMEHLIEKFREFHGKEWKRKEIKKNFLEKYGN